MTLLIDAYNVLKQGRAAPIISQVEVRRFVSLLGQYAKLKGFSITVVFDGGDFQRPTAFCEGAVTTIYAGYGRSADEVVVEKMLEYCPGEVMVVSSDREICSEAARYEIATIEAVGFFDYVRGEVTAQQRISCRPKQVPGLYKRPGCESSPEVDLLMTELIGRVPNKVDDLPVEGGRRLRRKGKKSKLERRIDRLVKKL
ncbi:MAG: NYN domain-containing protein [Candidatus Babeliaceae bacterium]|nr:NYN domain-containing protein [Candidatus Babeliaceae bacterium]